MSNRRQRHRVSVIGGLALGLILICSCAVRPDAAPEEIYRTAQSLQRRGDLNTALAEAGRGIQKLDSTSLWYWRLRLLEAETLLLQGKAAQASNVLPERLPNGAEYTKLEPQLLLYRGWVQYLQSDFAEARRLFDRAEQSAKSNGAPGDVTVSIGVRRATLDVRLGNFAAAERRFAAAIALARSISDAYWESAATGSFGFSLMNASRFDEAVYWFEKSLILSERNIFDSITSSNVLNLGWCYYKLGDLDRALKLYQRAEKLSRKMGKVHTRQIAIGVMGGIYQERGDLAKAIASYREALHLAQTNGEDFWSAKWLNNLGDALLRMGDADSAERYNRQALAFQDRLNDPRARLWPLINQAGIAAARRQYASARDILQSVIRSAKEDPEPRWEAQAQLARLHVATNQMRLARVSFQNAIDTVEQGRSRLVQDDSKLSFLARLVTFYQDYVDFLMAQRETTAALEVADSCRARLLSEKLELGPPGKAADFRRAAQIADAVLLSFWLAPRRSFVWVTTKAAITAFELPPDRQIQTLVDRYLTTLLDVRDPIQTRSAAGRQLFEMLIGSARSLIPPGSKVIVVPDGCLHRLNLETLITPGESPHYWLEDVQLTVAPSLSMLKPQGAARMNNRDSLLLIGDPVSPGPEFPVLPNAGTEIRSIEKRFAGMHVRVLSRADASPEAYRDSHPGNFAIIHFAAHAAANRESPLDSAVILSPKGDSYKLYAREVRDIPLQAQLVTISACRSAGARTFSGEGPVGLAWAFLQAGARNVIAGLWDVNDTSTAQLMDEFYTRLRAGEDPAPALRQAKLSMARSAGVYRKPYYWAPFQVYARVVEAPARTRDLLSARRP